MMPSLETLKKDVDVNYEELFGSLKLSKKAEKAVRSLLLSTIALGHKVRYIEVLHNQIAVGHNMINDALKHQFVEANNGDSNETENQEAQ